ncbi:T9SS type A sorting domain-containing protein [candidate division WOR-3 bacterium]|nr:T9SS type A sorting domain-containing protein [candidate division WOR-3 bacterium]
MLKKFLVLTIIISCTLIWAQEEIEITPLAIQYQTPHRKSHFRFADDVKITDGYVPHKAPEIDDDPQNYHTAYCAFEGKINDYPAILIFKTNDGGYTWTQFGGIFNTNNYELLLGSIVVTQNRVCISYTRENTPERVIAYSLPKTGGTGNFYAFPQIPADESRMSKKRGMSDVIDIVFIYEYGTGGAENCVVYYKSTDGGLSWINECYFAINEDHEGPDVYHIPLSDTIYIVWYADALDTLKFAKSTNGGSSFASQVIPIDIVERTPKICANDAYVVILGGSTPSTKCVWSNNGGINWYEINLPVACGENDAFAICFGGGKFRAACFGTSHNIKYKAVTTPSSFSSSWLRINDVDNTTFQRIGICYMHSDSALVVWTDYREGTDKIFCDNESWQAGVEEDKLTTNLAKVYTLSQNYPNPFSTNTTIFYQVPSDCYICLRIHNVAGKRVRTLVSKNQGTGNYAVKWDSKDEKGKVVPSGIYFYYLNAGNYINTKRMILIH